MPMTDDTTAIADQQIAKQAWTTPSIETYDVTLFTLGTGTQGDDGDGVTNIS